MCSTAILLIRFIWLGTMLYHVTEAQSTSNNQSGHLQQFYSTWTTGYDNRIRPRFQYSIADPVEVKINILDLGINLESMDFHSEVQMDLQWFDTRLQWNSSEIWNVSLHEGLFGQVPQGDRFIILPDEMFELFWKPDVFFKNSKSAERHEVTQNNRGYVVFEDGMIIQRERVGLVSTCFYDLQLYPFDFQSCFIEIECYKHSTSQIELKWYYNTSYAMTFGANEGGLDSGLSFHQEWKMVNSIPTVTELAVDYSTGSFSRLKGEFKIIRNYSYTVVHTYIPSILVVIMSIVGFWIDNEDAIERVTLAVTVILTLTTLNEGIREGVPEVSYLKGLDVWMLFVTLLVYLTLFQSAYVHYICRCGTKEPSSKKYKQNSVSPDVENEPPKVHYYNLKENTPETALEAARKVNLYSKIAFPLVFAIFNIVYWSFYLSKYYNCLYREYC